MVKHGKTWNFCALRSRVRPARVGDQRRQLLVAHQSCSCAAAERCTARRAPWLLLPSCSTRSSRWQLVRRLWHGAGNVTGTDHVIMTGPQLAKRMGASKGSNPPSAARKASIWACSATDCAPPYQRGDGSPEWPTWGLHISRTANIHNEQLGSIVVVSSNPLIV